MFIIYKFYNTTALYTLKGSARRQYRNYISPYNTKPLENKANNSYNYILGDLINGLAKESNNKDSKNVIDKGKAENYNNGSNNSNDTDNNNSRNGNSSNSNKGNKARKCIGQ